MTDQEYPVKRRRRRSRPNQTLPPRWPGDPAHGDGIDVDVEAVAYVLANTCRWGGRTQRFLSLAQHGLTMSEAIEALDGVAGEDRRTLALHALLVPAPAAWLGDEEGEYLASARAAARVRAHGAAIERVVREAAGLDPELPEDWSEVLRFVALMTDAAERRDMGVGGARTPFLPLRRTIRPMAPEVAAERWLARFRDLTRSSHADAADVHAGSGATNVSAAAAVEASQ